MRKEKNRAQRSNLFNTSFIKYFLFKVSSFFKSWILKAKGQSVQILFEKPLSCSCMRNMLHFNYGLQNVHTSLVDNCANLLYQPTLVLSGVPERIRAPDSHQLFPLTGSSVMEPIFPCWATHKNISFLRASSTLSKNYPKLFKNTLHCTKTLYTVRKSPHTVRKQH